jgi:hypothetical protein
MAGTPPGHHSAAQISAASYQVSGDARWLLATTIVVFVLLLGAADVSWDLLVRESEEVPPRG